MKVKQSDAVDQDLVLEAIAKRKRGRNSYCSGSRRRSTESRSVRKNSDAGLLPDHTAKALAEMSGRQPKFLAEQANLYGLPFGDRVIDLPILVRRLHDFLAKLGATCGKWIKTLLEGDYDAEGPQTESLDRLRTAKAEKEEFGLQVLKKKYLPVDEIQDLFAVIASGFATDTGQLAAAVLVRGDEHCEGRIDDMERLFGREIQNLREQHSHVGSELGIDTDAADGDSAAPAGACPRR